MKITYYRDFKILFAVLSNGKNYYRYESISGGSVSVDHWRTLRGVMGAIDREYRSTK